MAKAKKAAEVLEPGAGCKVSILMIITPLLFSRIKLFRLLQGG